ncbi:MAG: oligosaccharide flippase family protein [Actinomycetota bacterium]|nr:oligosaccharide flippase family protein [Actinomycetota bacterium]
MNEFPPTAARADSADSTPQHEGQLLVRGGLVRVFAYASMVILSVLWTVILARRLGVVRFGVYTSAMSIATMVATLSDGGMGNFATREYASRHGADRARLMGDIFGLRVTSAAIGTCLAACFALAVGYRLPLLLGVVVATAAVLPLVSAHTMWLPLINELRLGLISGLEVLRQAIWGCLLVGLVLAGAGLFPLLASLVVANVAVLAVTLRISRGLDRPQLALRPRAWPTLLRGAVAFSAATAVGTVYMYTTQIVTSLVASPQQTGLFSVSFRVFVVTATIPTLVTSSALPVLSRAARDDRERLAYVVKRLIELSFAAGIGLALTMAAAAGFVVLVVGGESFRRATGVLEIQALAMIATFATSPCSYGLLAQGRYRGLLWANGSALVVTILATALLAGAFGAIGAAVATICGEVTLAVLMIVALLKHHPESRPDTGAMLRLLLATALTVPIAFASVIPSLLRALAVGSVYLVLVLALRALPPEIMQAGALLRHRAAHRLWSGRDS